MAHLRTFIAASRRRWRRLAVVWIFIVSSVITVTALTEPRYRSECKLFLRLGRENAALDPTVTIGGGTHVAMPLTREFELNSVVAVLDSRGLAERVVDALGPDFILEQPPAQTAQLMTTPSGPPSTFLERLNPLESLPDRERAIKEFRSRLAVEGLKKSNIIDASYDASAPERAQRVLQTLVDIYLEQHARLNRTPGSYQFLKEQSEHLLAELQAKEEELRRSKDEAGIVSPEEHRQLLEQRNGKLAEELLLVDASLDMAKAATANLEANLSNLPAMVASSRVEGTPNAAADLMQQAFYQLQLEEQKLRSKLTEKHSDLQQIHERVANAKSILDQVNRDRVLSTTSLNTTQEQLQLRLLTAQSQQASFQAKRDRIVKQLQELKAEIVHANDKAQKINRLEREVAIQEATCRRYADNLEETRLDSALEVNQITNVGVAQSPTLEYRMARPRKLMNYALGFLAATLTVIGWSLSMDFPFRDATAFQSNQPQVLPPGSRKGRGRRPLSGEQALPARDLVHPK